MREVFECNLLLCLQLSRRRTHKPKLVFKDRRKFRTVSEASPTASLGSVSPVVESPVYEWCRHTILAIGAPKRWWRTGSNAEGVNDVTRGARKEGAIFFDSLTADSQSSRWHSRWNSGAALHVTASLLSQEIKPLLSTNLPDGSRFSAFGPWKQPSPGYFFDSLCQYL